MSPERGNASSIFRGQLSSPSQLLARNRVSLAGSNVLVVGYPADDFYLFLGERLSNARLTAFGFDYASHQYLRGHPLEGLRLVFDSYYPPPAESHDLAIVYLPKSRALLELVLTMTAAALQPGGKLLLVGENKAGIRSARSLLERCVGPVTASDAARHCVLFQAQTSPHPFEGGEVAVEGESRAGVEHYQKGEVGKFLDAWQMPFSVQIRNIPLTLISFPGVFSHGRFDDGTRLLLENLGLSPQARVLDFGCGCGVIGAFIKKRWPSCEVVMVDSNALALEAARRTMPANSSLEVHIHPSDVFSDVRGEFTHIVSNPPFHTGVETDYRPVGEFLQAAGRHLTADGSLWLVANRFLKYRSLIENHVGKCRIVAENGQYVVYEGRRA